MSLQRVPTRHETRSEEGRRCGDDNADHVGKEEQGRPECKLPFRELQSDADNRKRRNKSNRDGNTGEDVGGVAPDLAIRTCRSGGECDAEIEKVRGRASHQLRRERGRHAGNQKRDHRGEQDRKERTRGNEQCAAHDPARPTHDNRRRHAKNREHEGCDEHRSNDHSRGVPEDAEHGDRCGQHHQRDEPGEELPAWHPTREQLVDDLPTFGILKRRASTPQALDAGPREKHQTAEHG